MLTITLEKHSLRRLDPAVMREQLTYVVLRALGGNRGRVWELVGNVKTPESKDNGEGYVYSASLKFRRTGRKTTPQVIQQQEATITRLAADAGRSKGWKLPTEERREEAKEEPVQAKTFTTVNLIDTDLNAHFSHLYERDSQIALIRSALDAYTQSNYEDRFHSLLYGPPACGKTEILRSFARMLGSDAVLTFDATSTTKAGVERILLETERLPPILIVEEIEKTDENSLRWLLGVLDHRGEVRKVTHRYVAAKSVKLLCLATVNDIDLFRKVMDGALASRFSHQIYCPRPSREVLHRILEREVTRVQGNPQWIAPALDWCLDEEQNNDPRRVITVCLSGRDALLTGEYQQHLRNTRPQD